MIKFIYFLRWLELLNWISFGLQFWTTTIGLLFRQMDMTHIIMYDVSMKVES